MLPLGLRVQDKLERLIDRHMQSLGRCFNAQLLYEYPLTLPRRLKSFVVFNLGPGALGAVWAAEGRL